VPSRDLYVTVKVGISAERWTTRLMSATSKRSTSVSGRKMCPELRHRTLGPGMGRRLPSRRHVYRQAPGAPANGPRALQVRPNSAGASLLTLLLRPHAFPSKGQSF
jgi:hypothetical protein